MNWRSMSKAKKFLEMLEEYSDAEIKSLAKWLHNRALTNNLDDEDVTDFIKKIKTNPKVVNSLLSEIGLLKGHSNTNKLKTMLGNLI